MNLWKKIVIYNPEDNNGSLMKSIRIAERAMKKYRKDGVIPLIRSTPSYMTNRLSEYISIRRGKLSKKIAGRKIIINVDSYTEIKALNHAKATENDMINDLVTEASDGDTIYDIGAHIGIHSCLLGISNTQSDIISFEPFPSNTVQYLKNTEINGVDSTLVPIALSDSTDLLSMTGDSNSTSTGAPSLDPDASKQNIHVISMSCDQFVSESAYNPPNIIKIDVEGAEQLVIDGMENTLSNSSCKTLYCEVHLPSDRGISIDDYGSTKEDLFKTLRDYGFDIEILNKRDTRISTIHIKAKK